MKDTSNKIQILKIFSLAERNGLFVYRREDKNDVPDVTGASFDSHPTLGSHSDYFKSVQQVLIKMLINTFYSKFRTDTTCLKNHKDS